MGTALNKRILSLRCSRVGWSVLDTLLTRCFSDKTTPISRWTDSRSYTSSNSKDNAFQNSNLRLWVQLCYHTLLFYSTGILTRFPFRNQGKALCKELPVSLGPTNPCPIAVHMEPFPTSVFKVLIWIFATTTKICSTGCSTQAHAFRFITTLAPSYTLEQMLVPMVEYRYFASAPSIFRASSFGRWVVTQSLAGSDFHGHRPAV